jgi:hypothetical protein
MATDLRRAGADARPPTRDTPLRAWRLPALALILACGLVFGATFLFGQRTRDDDPEPSRAVDPPSAPSAVRDALALRNPARLPALVRPRPVRRRSPAAREPEVTVAALAPEPAPEPPAPAPASETPVAAPSPPPAEPAPEQPVARPGPAASDPSPPAPDAPPAPVVPAPDPAPMGGANFSRGDD